MADPKPLPHLDEADAARFWSLVKAGQPGECWPWTASRFRNSYGRFSAGGRNLKAHRVAYFLHYGDDPADDLTCHACDNPPCCNPYHLFRGSPAANIQDCAAKGRLNTAAGDKHGARTKPERHARGEASGLTTLTAADVLEVRRLYAGGGLTQQAIATRFGVTRESIGVIVRGVNWKHLPVDANEAARVSRSNRVKAGEANIAAKLTADDVRQIRALAQNGSLNYAQIGERFGVGKQSVYLIVNRKTWQHVTQPHD